MIADLIGRNNKLVVLTTHKSYDRPRGFIVNVDEGQWDEGCWFSNYDYCHRWTRKTKGYLWDGITTTESKPAISTEAELTEERLQACPICKNKGGLQVEANVCLSCDSCLDCNDSLKDCLCYWGGHNGAIALGSSVKGEESD